MINPMPTRFFDSIVAKAQARSQTIVLAEGEDPRVIEAAQRAQAAAIASCVLVGNEARIRQNAASHGFDLGDIRIEDPAVSPQLDAYAAELYRLRKEKGVSEGEARTMAQDPLCFSDLMLRANHADGAIAGAVYTTGDRVRSALRIVGVAPGFNSVSSFMLMLFEAAHHRPWHVKLFADCGLLVNPDAEQLAEIAVATARSAQQLLNEEPRVAMLSFSTDGSANHPHVEKVREATKLARRQMPMVEFEGEVQLDAAIDPEIAKQKISDSRLQGTANVLIYPDLDAGNIGYKLTQRFGGATAVGPILQGLGRPANDLSRGCNADDVYYLIALTALQSLG